MSKKRTTKKIFDNKHIKKTKALRKTKAESSNFTLSDYRVLARFFKLQNFTELYQSKSVKECASKLESQLLIGYYRNSIEPIFNKLGMFDTRNETEKYSHNTYNTLPSEVQKEYVNQMIQNSNNDRLKSIKFLIQCAIFDGLSCYHKNSIADIEHTRIQNKIIGEMTNRIVAEIDTILEPYYKISEKYKIPLYSKNNDNVIIGFQGHSAKFKRFIDASISRDKTGAKRVNRDDFNDAVFMETKKPNNKFETLTALIRKVQNEHPEYLPKTDHFRLDKVEQDKIMKRLKEDYRKWAAKNTD